LKKHQGATILRRLRMFFVSTKKEMNQTISLAEARQSIERETRLELATLTLAR
jgi:hypothetical protein